MLSICKICGRKLTTKDAIAKKVGPICLRRVLNRYPKFEGKPVDEFLNTNKFCFGCENFKSSKRGKNKTEYELNLIGRGKDEKVDYDINDAIVGKCKKYNVFVDGNIITICQYHKKRNSKGGS